MREIEPSDLGFLQPADIGTRLRQYSAWLYWDLGGGTRGHPQPALRWRPSLAM